MKFLSISLFVVALAASSFAQSPSRTLKQAEKALGGEKALKSLQSATKTGTIRRLADGAEGKYLLQTVQPVLYNMSIDLDGFEIESGYNGRSGWSRNSKDGLQTFTGPASHAMQTLASYRNSLWLNAKNDKAKLVSGMPGTVNGRSANAVVMNTPKGASLRIFFDPATGLPVRDEVKIGDDINICDYSDYRDVTGIKHPFAQRCTIEGEDYEIRITEIKPNAQIARSEFDFPNLSAEPLPDIRALLKELEANEEKVEDILDTYSFTQKEIKRELGKDGQMRETESETRELSFYKGYRINRLVEKNGKPLTPKEQEKEDKDVEKQVEEIEKRIAKTEAAIAKGKPPAEEERKISVAEVLKASNLLNPRRERFRGRDVIVFDFEPNPNFDMKDAKSALKFFGKTAGVMWVDEKDKQVARIHAVLADSYKIGGGLLAKLNKGAAFTLERERIGDEIWLPAHTEINIAIRVFLVKGIDVNQVIKSYGYRKVLTEVTGAEVNEVKKP